MHVKISCHTVYQRLEPEEKPRMGVVITARVHPGETNSSWIMQGLIDFLISDSAHAKVTLFTTATATQHFLLFLDSEKSLCV